MYEIYRKLYENHWEIYHRHKTGKKTSKKHCKCQNCQNKNIGKNIRKKHLWCTKLTENFMKTTGTLPHGKTSEKTKRREYITKPPECVYLQIFFLCENHLSFWPARATWINWAATRIFSAKTTWICLPVVLYKIPVFLGDL